MNSNRGEGGCPSEIRVFTFTIMGVRIGIDADQVAAVMDVEAAAGRGLPIRRFEELLPIGHGPVAYAAPKVLLVRGTEGPSLLVIDHPDDLAVVSVKAIQPLPPVIAGGCPPLLWGAVAGPDGVLLLVDLLRV